MPNAPIVAPSVGPMEAWVINEFGPEADKLERTAEHRLYAFARERDFERAELIAALEAYVDNDADQFNEADDPLHQRALHILTKVRGIDPQAACATCGHERTNHGIGEQPPDGCDSCGCGEYVAPFLCVRCGVLSMHHRMVTVSIPPAILQVHSVCPGTDIAAFMSDHEYTDEPIIGMCIGCSADGFRLREGFCDGCYAERAKDGAR